jgi:hypothetical protein
MRRTVTALITLACAVVGILTFSFGTAGAAPAPTSITIEGPGVARPITVSAAEDKESFAKLHNEVNWLATRAANAPDPDTTKLGLKYSLLVRLDEKPDQVYHLYPYAVGGPRVFRPAEQPHKRKTTAAWFYGRVSMPETLHDAGVPLLSPVSQQLTGGRGGGEGEIVPPGSNPDGTQSQSIGELLSQWQQGVLLTGALAVVMVLGLAGVSLLVRRY